MSVGLKGLHDRLLEQQPEGVEHVPASCPLCAMEAIDTGGDIADDQPRGGDHVGDLNELQAAIDKAVAEATSTLQAKVTELEAASSQSELETAVAAAKAEAQTQIDELQTKLDAAVLEAAAAKQSREELEAFLTAEAEKEAAEKDKAEKAEARKAEVKEAEVGFTDEYIEANVERFAAMSDEDWKTNLESWKEIAGKRGDTTIPTKTGFVASREDTTKKTGSTNLGVLADLRGANDPRTL